MDLRLEPDLADFVEELVSSGRFPSKEAVIVSAVRQMRDFSARKAQIQRSMFEETAHDVSGALT